MSRPRLDPARRRQARKIRSNCTVNSPQALMTPLNLTGIGFRLVLGVGHIRQSMRIYDSASQPDFAQTPAAAGIGQE
jgi:hypothetical protein